MMAATVFCELRRSPHGERGLKYREHPKLGALAMSLSSWRAWIEIATQGNIRNAVDTSLSSWRAWIEIQWIDQTKNRYWGRSPHGERGLKSKKRHKVSRPTIVALLMESVD